MPRSQPLPRRTLSLAVIEHSLNTLDTILLRADPDIVRLIEAAYIAACRIGEKRFGESVVIGWTVCEQLISITWKELIAGVGSRAGGPDRMPRVRREKLNGRDYTASVMVELLELSGKIDHELYRMLEVARKARNAWAHDMKVPHQSAVVYCQRAVERMLRQVLGFQFFLQPGGRGGVPQWPIWVWEQVKAQDGTKR